jgi:hypothetical protein
LGHDAKRQKTLMPQPAKEKQMISKNLWKIWGLHGATRSKDGKNMFWEELPNLTRLPNDIAQAMAERAGEPRTEEELTLSNITDKFFDEDRILISREIEIEIEGKGITRNYPTGSTNNSPLCQMG